MICLLSSVISVLPATASAQDRTALVVANFDYGEHQLAHVKADAAAVGEVLRREGFRVTLAENVPVKELKNTVEQFARSTVTRGVAVLYFAGLGGQYQTYNSKGACWTHLQGAGKPADPNRPDRESLALADVVKLVADHSSAGANLLVLDAARPNPFLAERDNQPDGLAAVEATEVADDTLVDSKIKGVTADGVIRRGAWCSTAEYCASAFRNPEFAGKQRDYIGFRVVMRKK